MQFGLDRDRQAEGLGRVVRDLYDTMGPPPEAEHTDGTGLPSPCLKADCKEPAPKGRSRSKEPPKATAAKHARAPGAGGACLGRRASPRRTRTTPVSYTHLRAHETLMNL
eukprot:2227732-Prymnesium_polylepis.2